MLIWLIFTVLIGACVGSFLNVVIYRLPAGLSLVRPPSSCPKCSHKLAWFDNVPVFGWLWLRGRCRYCKTPISPQYPLIEALTAAFFGGWFVLSYGTDLRPAMSGPGLEGTWPILVTQLVLLGALIAATVIDARLFVIPISICYFVVACALILMPATPWLCPGAVVEVHAPMVDAFGDPQTARERMESVPEPYRGAAEVRVGLALQRPGPFEVSAAPLVTSRASATAMGSFAGLIIACVLLWRRILPMSFVLEEGVGAPLSSDPKDWPVHPRPRHEVLKECLFLSLPLLGAIVGWWLAPGSMSLAARVLGGVMIGYLAGAATVWSVRILGTLVFGREAMGLGDVHLMAAVGAVMGPQLAVIAFFIAPFFGLVWALAAFGFARIWNRQVRHIPFGPHLALASVVAWFAREPVAEYLGQIGLF